MRRPTAAQRSSPSDPDKVALGLLEDHANHCIAGGDDSQSDERTAELMGAVKRLLRHG